MKRLINNAFNKVEKYDEYYLIENITTIILIIAIQTCYTVEIIQRWLLSLLFETKSFILYIFYKLFLIIKRQLKIFLVIFILIKIIIG